MQQTFYDQVSIVVQSGKGGDGVISGRREKGVPFGGPAGGDGGTGGSIIFQADTNEYTLLPYRYKTVYKAKNGEQGQSKEKYGAAADDIILKVPVGTVIKDVEHDIVVAHLTDDAQQYVAVSGGKGGLGNMHFVSPENQYPQIALYGEPGEKKQLVLELQLLGDVALIGTPSVGKSTLINAVSNVKAKTAAYEFTTLVPNIGVVEHKHNTFIMVDVPGLIQGAHGGKGLGSDFLRHILKARIWTIMIDASKDIPGISERGLLLAEITEYIERRFVGSNEYGPTIEHLSCFCTREEGVLRYTATASMGGEEKILLKKAIITVVNKYDVLDDEVWVEYRDLLVDHIQDALGTTYHCPSSLEHITPHIHHMSALTYKDIDLFLDTCITVLADTSAISLAEYASIDVHTISHTSIIETTSEDIPLLIEKEYLEEEQAKNIRVRSIRHPDIGYYTFVLPWGNDEIELWYWRTLKQAGHLSRMEQAGAQHGDILRIYSPYNGVDDKYIMRV